MLLERQWDGREREREREIGLTGWRLPGVRTAPSLLWWPPQSVSARQSGRSEYQNIRMSRSRHRNSSYSSSTLSSNSSTSSSATYASIKSISSSTSRISSHFKSGEFWNRFSRKTPTSSVLSLIQHLFSPKVKGEPSKPSSSTVITMETETSFSSPSYSLPPPSTYRRAAHPPTQPPSLHFSSPCPVGLYCVIDDFLTEYDLRLLEEEERADLIARKSKEINKVQNPNITVL